MSMTREEKLSAYRMALELRMSHGLPPDRNIIPEPEVAREYFRIKRVVAELYDIAKEAA